MQEIGTGQSLSQNGEMSRRKGRPKKNTQESRTENSEEQTAIAAQTGKRKRTHTARKPKQNKQKQKQHPKQNTIDITTLFTSNVFTDTAGHANAPDQPGFTESVKTKALTQLLASIPNEGKAAAKQDRDILMDATKAFTGQGSCRSDGMGGWKLRGMKSSLTHYQVLGTAFMRNRETGGDQPLGGLCADAMGLGKTVMMIANMVNGKPLDKNAECKTTLIVASATLISQWASELKKHCEEKTFKGIVKYCAGHRMDSQDAVPFLKSKDVVLTTYHEVMRSFPKPEYPLEIQTVEEKKRWWNAYFAETKGPLHSMKFHRVV